MNKRFTSAGLTSPADSEWVIIGNPSLRSIGEGLPVIRLRSPEGDAKTAMVDFASTSTPIRQE